MTRGIADQFSLTPVGDFFLSYSALVNSPAGGPGNPPFLLLKSMGQRFQSVIGTEFDIVAFDPRGEWFHTKSAKSAHAMAGEVSARPHPLCLRSKTQLNGRPGLCSNPPSSMPHPM